MSDPYNPGPGFQLRSPYGSRRDPVTGEKGQFHSGQDFAASPGTPIPAAMAGVVVYSGFNKNLGNTVIVRNGAGEYNLYAHMKDGVSRAQIGQKIWPGDVLGQVGSTGARTTGPHLHYSVIRKEIPRSEDDPRKVAVTVRQSDSDGGPINVDLNKATTIDPAKYDVAPYLDQTRRAQQLLAPNAFAGAPTANPASTAPLKTSPARDGSLPSGDTFNDRFGSWKSLAPDGAVNAPAPEARQGGLPGLIADQLLRQGSVAPAPPSDETASTGDPASFDERFKAASSIRRLSSPLDALMWR